LFFSFSLSPHIVAWFHHSIWRHIINFLRCLTKILINRKRTHTHTEKGNVHSNHHHMISTMFFCSFFLCSFPLLYTQLLPDCIVCLIFYVHGITYKQQHRSIVWLCTRFYLVKVDLYKSTRDIIRMHLYKKKNKVTLHYSLPRRWW